MAEKKPKAAWKPKTPKAKPELPEGLVRALATRKASADSEGLLSHLIDRWGGTERLAHDIYGEFQKAPKGGMTRQRIIEMIQRLILSNQDRGLGSVVKPSDLSDEELDALALSYTKRVTNVGQPDTATGPEQA